jgi:hypothetical protein
VAAANVEHEITSTGTIAAVTASPPARPVVAATVSSPPVPPRER